MPPRESACRVRPPVPAAIRRLKTPDMASRRIQHRCLPAIPSGPARRNLGPACHRDSTCGETGRRGWRSVPARFRRRSAPSCGEASGRRSRRHRFRSRWSGASCATARGSSRHGAGWGLWHRRNWPYGGMVQPPTYQPAGLHCGERSRSFRRSTTASPRRHPTVPSKCRRPWCSSPPRCRGPARGASASRLHATGRRRRNPAVI